MTKDWKDIAHATLAGSEDNTMTFRESVRMLMEGGFDGYIVDFRHGTRTYYRPDGESLELATESLSVPVAECFDIPRQIGEALRVLAIQRDTVQMQIEAVPEFRLVSVLVQDGPEIERAARVLDPLAHGVDHRLRQFGFAGSLRRSDIQDVALVIACHDGRLRSAVPSSIAAQQRPGYFR
jgi:hypothetical protein